MQIDEFESQFKSAIREPYLYEDIRLETILVILDQDNPAESPLATTLKRFVPDIAESHDGRPIWRFLGRQDFSNVRELLGRVEQLRPGLIIAERNLGLDEEHNLIYGLTNYIDSLTQVTTIPVLLLPNKPQEELARELTLPKNVALQTDHLTGDNNIINWGIRFAEPDGALLLTHIEDDKTFRYYLAAIEKIPQINSSVAENVLREMLLKEPLNFITEVRNKLSEEFPEISISEIVRFGHTLSDYKAVLDNHQVDLLIINTKEDQQLAMKGIAYAIAVEFKNTPLLLL